MRLSFDLLAALIVAILAGIASAFFYRKIIAIETFEQNYLASFRPGVTNYALLSQEKCVGQIKVTFATTPGEYLTAEGMLRLKFLNHTTEANLKASGYFNALGQLVSGVIAISANNNNLKITLQDPNPLLVTISRTNDSLVQQGKWSIPGPLVLLENHEQNIYKLFYSPPIDRLSPLLKQLTSVHQTENFLSFDSNPNQIESCTGADLSTSALTIDRYLPLLESLNTSSTAHD